MSKMKYNGSTSRSLRSTRSSTLSQYQSQTQSQSLPSAPVEPKRMFRRQHPADDDEDYVGVLKFTSNGSRLKLIMEFGSAVLEIGRDPVCAMRVEGPEVSGKHLRLYNVRTVSNLTVTCLHDISRNGYILNGVEYSQYKPAQVGERIIHRQSRVLEDGDQLQLPGSDIVFHYKHNFHYHGPIPPSSNTNAESMRSEKAQIHRPEWPKAVFMKEDEPSATYSLGQWVIHNYQIGSGAYAYVNLANHVKGTLQVACKTIKMKTAKETKGEKEASLPWSDHMDMDDLESLDGSPPPEDRHTDKFKSESWMTDEIKILRCLSHPNIAGFLDVVAEEEHERIHLIVELVTGGDLFSYMDKHASLTEDEVKFFAFQLVKGTQYLHGKEIAHRDIKPENVLIHISCSFPRLILTDFGQVITLANLIAEVPETNFEQCTRAYHIAGTAQYLPPERLKALVRPPRGTQGFGEDLSVVHRRRDLAKRWMQEEKALDVWALGCTLFTCIAGRHPYDASQDADAPGEDEEDEDIGEIDSFSPTKMANGMMSYDNPYYRTSFERTGNPAEMVPQPRNTLRGPLRELTSGPSWDAFRMRAGQGTLGGTRYDMPSVQNRNEFARMKDKLDRWRTLHYAEWEPADKFQHISEATKVYIDILLTANPTRRAQLEHGDWDDYFASSRSALETMYDEIVIKGKMWHKKMAKL